jgi:hypothetical protein
MDKRFFCAARTGNITSPVAKPVNNARHEPDGNDEIH